MLRVRVLGVRAGGPPSGVRRSLPWNLLQGWLHTHEESETCVFGAMDWSNRRCEQAKSTGRQADRQTGRQADKQTNKRTKQTLNSQSGWENVPPLPKAKSEQKPESSSIFTTCSLLPSRAANRCSSSLPHAVQGFAHEHAEGQSHPDRREKARHQGARAHGGVLPAQGVSSKAGEGRWARIIAAHEHVEILTLPSKMPFGWPRMLFLMLTLPPFSCGTV